MLEDVSPKSKFNSFPEVLDILEQVWIALMK